MAGSDKKGIFVEKISPFLIEKMREIKEKRGEESKEYKALFSQYTFQPKERLISLEINKKHWEADLKASEDIKGLERLYNNTAAIETTMVCAAHCRYCLRSNYEIFTLTEHELLNIAKYCGSSSVRDELNELLITGGDPLILPGRLNFLIDSIENYAPNIRTIRIATRLPLHNPERIDENVYSIFKKHSDRIHFELATQVNHPVDLFPESIKIFKNIRELGVTIYSQNVLLKGVNDDVETLAALYNKLRNIGIESHYLFHCVPMKGMGHFRNTVSKGINLIQHLTNSGIISGRAKPMFALMTDIGKVTMYEGTILDRKENMILVQSSYEYAARMKNNPNWEMPKTAYIDENGLIRIWYMDGNDD